MKQWISPTDAQLPSAAAHLARSDLLLFFVMQKATPSIPKCVDVWKEICWLIFSLQTDSSLPFAGMALEFWMLGCWCSRRHSSKRLDGKGRAHKKLHSTHPGKSVYQTKAFFYRKTFNLWLKNLLTSSQCSSVFMCNSHRFICIFRAWKEIFEWWILWSSESSLLETVLRWGFTQMAVSGHPTRSALWSMCR